MAKRAAQGSGTIRKKTVTRKGKQYIYWEARITTGRDPGTGKQIQQSFTGKTQKEVREKMQAAAVAVNTGIYIPPQKMTVGQWLDTWAAEYLGNRKKNTVRIYQSNIRKHIKPALGAIKLSDLRPHDVQFFVNGLDELSAASIHLAYKVLRMALEKAVQNEYIPRNPAVGCALPKVNQPEMHPLTDEEITALLRTAKGNPYEHLIVVALFTGLRLGELLGLTWDSANLNKGTIFVSKQLADLDRDDDDIFMLPKNNKTRTLTVATSVILALKAQRRRQIEMRLKAGQIWNNPHNLVFTLEDGSLVDRWRVQREFKDLLTAAGIENVRFHDLRHTYAVNAIRAGDDIKTLQGNLGHASAAFTLDRYGHFTERMKQDSAARMDNFTKNVLNL
ncbi:MAG: site-specific integrase [Lachnospiraceae bacterium]|nr:site-specific integrase [Lachnospiraceae bacterium]